MWNRGDSSGSDSAKLDVALSAACGENTQDVKSTAPGEACTQDCPERPAAPSPMSCRLEGDHFGGTASQVLRQTRQLAMLASTRRSDVTNDSIRDQV